MCSRHHDNMAFARALLMLSLVAILVPDIITAKEIIVGGEEGWTIGFDYKAWAAKNSFEVGDKLVFQYTFGEHNVFKVNETAYLNCDIPPSNEAYTSGHDVLGLDYPGKIWYLCGVGDHCKIGQKLEITVMESSSPSAFVSPAPAPASKPSSHHNRKSLLGRLLHRYFP